MVTRSRSGRSKKKPTTSTTTKEIPKKTETKGNWCDTCDDSKGPITGKLWRVSSPRLKAPATGRHGNFKLLPVNCTCASRVRKHAIFRCNECTIKGRGETFDNCEACKSTGTHSEKGHTVEEVIRDYNVLKILAHRKSSKKNEEGEYFLEYKILYDDASTGWESKHTCTTRQIIYDYWRNEREVEEIMWGIHCDVCNRSPSKQRFSCKKCEYDLCGACNKIAGKMHRHKLQRHSQVKHTSTRISSLISPTHS